MVAYNFKKQFADDVESGRKRQTIRAGEPRCKPGDALQLYTGQRTKVCRKLRDEVCKQVRPISIRHAVSMIGGWDIALNGRLIVFADEGNPLAQADGFENAAGLCRWFEETHGLPFDGHVVNW